MAIYTPPVNDVDFELQTYTVDVADVDFSVLDGISPTPTGLFIRFEMNPPGTLVSIDQNASSGQFIRVTAT